MCDLDEDKNCSFESIILAILAAARRVIADKAPKANRIVIFNEKKIKSSHARDGMNKQSPILSIDLYGESEAKVIMVWYGTRIWFCSKPHREERPAKTGFTSRRAMRKAPRARKRTRRLRAC